jgi:hypothetical protein
MTEQCPLQETAVKPNIAIVSRNKFQPLSPSIID